MMNDFISKDKKTINLPVPLGTTIYSTTTVCGDFCLFQKEKFKEVFSNRDDGKCDSAALCHTIKKQTSKVVLTLDNLGFVLEKWGFIYFATFEEAEKAAEDRVARNIEGMKRLGFKIDERGYSAVTKTNKEDD